MADTLLNKLKKTTRLPSPPGTALQILNLCQKNDVSLGELADTVAADPALSLRLLKYANSSLVGCSKEVTSVRDAVLLLGMRSVRLMALSFSLISSDDRRACQGFDYGRFWLHSVGRAVTARYLSKAGGGCPPEEAFAVGLLSRLGQLVFAVCLSQQYSQLLAKSNGVFNATAELEREEFGNAHYEVGAELIAEWGIPGQFAEAIRYQEQAAPSTDDLRVKQLASLLGVSGKVADMLCNLVPEEQAEQYWQELAASEFFKTADQAREIVEQIREEFTELATVLNLRQGLADNADEIEAEAGEVLEGLSLAAQLKSDAVEKENQGLQQKAWTDALTKIANRAAFDRRLGELFAAAISTGKPLSLVIMDIDFFKKFNDTYGHQTGDAVLAAVGPCLAKSVRDIDFVARYGGEEFVAILPGADHLIAAQLCVKMRKAIEACPVEFQGNQHHVTVSLGAAIAVKPTAPLTAQKMVEAADKQLYFSKKKGRNCCSMTLLNTAPAASAPRPAAAAAGR